MNHVVSYSGGVGSWASAKRVVDTYGADTVTCLTANTLSEHDDWLPFVETSVEALGVKHVMLTVGVDVWELAVEQKMLSLIHI